MRVPVENARIGGPVNTLEWCPQCGSVARRLHRSLSYDKQRERIDQYSQRTGRSARQTFDTFELQETQAPYSLTIRNLYNAAQSFARQPRGWLVLYGTKGTGKTHLASAILNALEAKPELLRQLTMFLTAPDLLDLLRSGYRSNDYEDLLRLCQTVDVLILDDLGTESSTNWASEKLFQILNARYQAEAPTVIITNCKLEELSPRIYDRLCDDVFSTRIEVIAPSYRQRQSNPGAVIQ